MAAISAASGRAGRAGVIYICYYYYIKKFSSLSSTGKKKLSAQKSLKTKLSTKKKTILFYPTGVGYNM